MTKKLFTVALCCLSMSQLQAQKSPIDHSVYDSWKNIANNSISKSGNYIFYTVAPQEGDSYSELKDSKGNLILKIDRGTSPKLSKDEKVLIATIKPYFKETREAKIKKKKMDDMPKDSLLIFNINKQESQNIGAIKSSKTAFEFNNFIAYTQETTVPSKVDSTAKVDTASNKAGKKSPTKKDKKETVLIVRHTNTLDTIQLWKADEYAFSNDEKYLIYTKKSEPKDSSTIDGLYIYDLESKASKKISNGKGVYKGFTFDDNSNQLTFLADKSPAKSLTKDFKLYYYKHDLDTAHILVDKGHNSIPKDWYVSGDANLNFSANGNLLYLGLAPIPAVKDTTLVEFENAKVDIWHWQDDYLMPQQLVNLRRELSRSYDAVYNLKNNTLLPLIDDSFARTSSTDSANEEWIMATVSKNKIESQWTGYQPQDIYLISTIDGNKKLIKSDWIGQSILSPDAKHILLFNYEDENWYSYDIQSGTETNLSTGLNIKFTDEENDMPTYARSYGIAAWSDDNKGIYVNDRYDIWYFSLDGKEKKNITNGYGRQNKIVLRYLNIRKPVLRYNTTFISNNSNLILTSFNEITKENGFFSLKIGKSPKLNEIIQDKFTFRSFSSDDKDKLFVYSKENYQNSPDLYVSKDFKSEIKLTNINPQQDNYNWGTAELVKWTTPQGFQAEGILYKPENFDPNKKYPIIAYFYETLTQGLYSYQAPAPTPSRLNIPYFVSNEYLVFAPDIKYELGHPGKSAEEYVNSGMRHLAQNSWVDATKMAIQGQSWGGYQVAHLITRTDMYAAAWSGAPVVNMTSAYGGIRWQTGLSRQFQYEKTQSRIGATLWENRDLYIENSPLFFMDKVNTPVAIMHNDEDGAVPWYQGIEMFTALRRLSKPVWLLNYNGDAHNLMQRQNRKDIQKRQSQFFDHYLKGKPAAEWIKSGVSAKNKGINWGFDQ